MKLFSYLAGAVTAGMLVSSLAPVVVRADEVSSVSWNDSWEYADFSELHTGNAILHMVKEGAPVVAVNAGHGSSTGSAYQTLCHPDGSPKVTGGSTAEGAVYATAISGGTSMLDGTPEGQVTLSLALILRDRLLDAGYNVLMLREEEDTALDNIARTVISNNHADCHISLHYDSSETDKGLFFISVPDVESYRAMEPVASHWEEHIRLGESLLEGAIEAGVTIYGNGSMPIDLTQTSYSTIPSVDLEVGDRGSDYSEITQEKIADGILKGVELYFADRVSADSGETRPKTPDPEASDSAVDHPDASGSATDNLEASGSTTDPSDASDSTDNMPDDDENIFDILDREEEAQKEEKANTTSESAGKDFSSNAAPHTQSTAVGANGPVQQK